MCLRSPGSPLDRHRVVVLPGTMNSPGYRGMPPFEPLPAHGEWLHDSLRALTRRKSRRSWTMKALITGGMGVNGAVTARLMVQDGLRPVLMDNRLDLTLMGDIKDQVDIAVGDICDPAALEKAVDDYKVTHIAHLAALMPEPAEADPRLGVKVGVDGTVNVLEVARAKNIKRVVFTSSKAVYGEIAGECAPPACKPV